MSAPAAGVRADIWLWAARFFKTRAQAKQAIIGGKVEVNDLPCKPAKSLHVGDRLRVQRGNERMLVDVLQLSEQRGPAEVAQALYAESAASKAERERLREERRLLGSAADGPPTRPGKRDRRLIRRFKSDL